jgi:hypothetical protein
MSNVSSLWRNTKQMPPLLRMFCQGAMVVPPILALFLVLPLVDWTVNESELSYSELWSSGAGPVMLASMLMAAAGAWGLAARASWSRWLWVATPVVPLLVAAMYPKTWFTEQAAGNISTWLGALVTGAFIFLCLFLVPAVQAYVRGKPSDA